MHFEKVKQRDLNQLPAEGSWNRKSAVRTGGVTRGNADSSPVSTQQGSYHTMSSVCGSVLESMFQGLGRGDKQASCCFGYDCPEPLHDYSVSREMQNQDKVPAHRMALCLLIEEEVSALSLSTLRLQVSTRPLIPFWKKKQPNGVVRCRRGWVPFCC